MLLKAKGFTEFCWVVSGAASVRMSGASLQSFDGVVSVFEGCNTMSAMLVS